MGEMQLTTIKGIELSGRKAISPLRESADGADGKVWLGRDGALVIKDWYTAMAEEGRVFNIALATPDTTMTGDVGYVVTSPGIAAVVPEGTVMIPVHLDVCFEDAAGTDNYIIVGCDEGDLGLSGGTAVSACNNLRTDNPHASAISTKLACDTAAIAMTDPGASERTLFTYVNAFADATTSPPIQVVWEPRTPPVLVGPSTFYVYIYATSTAPEFSFSLQWVELPKNAVV
jgi:hypothetical protein